MKKDKLASDLMNAKLVDNKISIEEGGNEETYLVYVKYGDKQTDHYVKAKSEQDAIKKVKDNLPSNIKRWASVFV